MVIPNKIRQAVEETIKETAEAIAETTAQIEQLKEKLKEKERELESAYAILDMNEAPKERKKPGRKKKTEKGEEKEMVTPKELRSAAQVREHNKYMKNKAKKAAEKEAAEKPLIETIEEINEKARAAGMTYGEYISQELIQRQHEQMERSRALRRAKEREALNDSEGILEQDQNA